MNPSEIAERAADQLDALHEWEEHTGKPASCSEGNAFLDGYKAGRESRGQRLEDSFEYQAGGSHVLLSALPDPPKGNENV